MYLGMLIIFAFSPLALGSYWALMPVIFLVLTLALRIRGEEKELTEHLEGYKEYMMRTKYRLLPGIW
jgi:protein-S-isoprenylcysteine O-methyltransferase Ste14